MDKMVYKLLKDLPDALAGDIYEWNGAVYFNITRIAHSVDSWTVETSHQWFKEIRPTPTTPTTLQDEDKFWNDEVVRDYLIWRLKNRSLEFLAESEKIRRFKASKQANTTKEEVRRVGASVISDILDISCKHLKNFMDDLLYERCPTCNGEGFIEGEKYSEWVGDYASLVTCPTCNGERKILREYEPDEE